MGIFKYLNPANYLLPGADSKTKKDWLIKKQAIPMAVLATAGIAGGAMPGITPGIGAGSGAAAGPLDESIAGIPVLSQGGGTAAAAAPSLLTKALSFLGSHGKDILAVGNGIQGAVKGARASKQNSALLERALGNMDARQAQKQAMLKQIMDYKPQAPDLSGVFKTPNPY